MTPAPASGRTADENELREALARFLWNTRYGQLPDASWGGARELAKAIPDGAAASAVGAIWSQADALLSGPLAPILQEAAAARAEAADWKDDVLRLHREKVDRLERALIAEANLLALAKMYGEACRDLVYARSSEDDLFWQKEEAVIALSRKLVAAEQEAATLRARLQEAEKALKPFSAAVFNDNGDVTISTGHLTTRDWLAAKHALAALATPAPQTQEAGDHEPR